MSRKDSHLWRKKRTQEGPIKIERWEKEELSKNRTSHSQATGLLNDIF